MVCAYHVDVIVEMVEHFLQTGLVIVRLQLLYRHTEGGNPDNSVLLPDGFYLVVVDVSPVPVDGHRIRAREEAQAYAGDPKVDKELKKCEKEFEKADKKIAEGHYDKAINHYKKAWEHAQKALKYGT